VNAWKHIDHLQAAAGTTAARSAIGKNEIRKHLRSCVVRAARKTRRLVLFPFGQIFQ
jgi:hypothetical protein